MIAVTSDQIIADLAASLADAITEEAVEADSDPKNAYTNLACRVMLKLTGKKLTVLPEKAIRRIVSANVRRDALSTAAKRIFDIFTSSLTTDADQHFILRRSAGKFEIIVMSPTGVQAFFTGESAQDACAQAAQVLDLNGGTVAGADS